MSPCCGRPDNRAKKGEAGYYERYAYLSNQQKARQLELVGSKCTTCDALTVSGADNKCVVCGNPKTPKEVSS